MKRLTAAQQECPYCWDGEYDMGTIYFDGGSLDVALLGAYNVWEGEQDDLARFFRAWEKECVRIYRDECHENPEELKDSLMGHTKELRERMGIDDVPS